MTSTKAVAGGIAANVVTIALWLLSLIPGWESIPTEPKAALIALVSTLVGAGIVYFAPPNSIKVPSDSVYARRWAPPPPVVE
jgi:hypothetical protein